ncbi:MAG: DUF3048 domain-containing protein [Clostridiales bacterium]|nr:DUF3048 domain-containing protein [Clostridiales bacterium]
MKKTTRLTAMLLALLLLLQTIPALMETTLIEGTRTREALPFLDHYPDNPVIPGVSGTTGLPFEGVYAPVVLVLDNAPKAHPHWGVLDADVIYQVPNAGAGATKLLALFSDRIPAAAGGSRSARSPFVDVAREWGGGFAFAGYPVFKGANKASVVDKLRDAQMRNNKSAFNLLGNNNYSGRIKGYASPHNLSVDIQKVQELLIKSGKEMRPHPYLFTDALPSGYPAANQVTVRHYGGDIVRGRDNPASWSVFTYDAAQNAYLRENIAGPYVDRDAQETPLPFANVIVQRVRFSYSGNYVLLDHLTGTGAAEIFTGGQYIQGGWYKKDLDSRTVFVDEKGQEMQLQRGKTFIILTNETTTVEYGE